VRTNDELWPVVVAAAVVVGATAARLQSDMAPSTFTTFRHGFDDQPPGTTDAPDIASVRFLVPGGKTGDRFLELRWPDDRREVDRDTEIAIDIFCEYLGEAIELAKAPVVGLRSTRGAGTGTVA
jgi:hypothetical protein